jgi:hypothetical protein
MAAKNTDIGEEITDGRTRKKSIVLLGEGGLDTGVTECVVLPDNSNEAERIIFYGSNKADDHHSGGFYDHCLRRSPY